eukprot:190809-Hanusia_phi.AAC.2
MPSYEEISIFLDTHKTRLNLEKAKETMEEWGNIPRMILNEKHHTLTQEIAKIDSLKDLDSKIIIVGGPGARVTVVRPRTSRWLVPGVPSSSSMSSAV